MQLRLSLILVLLIGLSIPISACENSGDVEPAGNLATEPMIENEVPDTTRLRGIYGQIGTQYERMMAQYNQMGNQIPPELQQRYQMMQQRYEEVMPEGMMGPHMMGPGMMNMHRLNGWNQDMLEFHEQMYERHQQEGFENMASMHQQMIELYRQAAKNMPEREHVPR